MEEKFYPLHIGTENCGMSCEKKLERIFNSNFDLFEVLKTTKQKGYCFVSDALNIDLCEKLKQEALSLDLEFGDHRNFPINSQKQNQVRQTHNRSYHFLEDEKTPIANQLCFDLAFLILKFDSELKNWLLNEIGYQQYFQERNDWISPHRDRKSDELLSLTITMFGSAWVKIYEPQTNPINYQYLSLIDEFLTSSGTLMFLRAPGFGSGQQIIHEVCSPITEERLILNLRQRKTVLPGPKYFQFISE
jgi:hypothetical protein